MQALRADPFVHAQLAHAYSLSHAAPSFPLTPLTRIAPLHTRNLVHTRCAPPSMHTRSSLLIPTPKIHPPHRAHIGTRQLQSQHISLSHTHTDIQLAHFPPCSGTQQPQTLVPPHLSPPRTQRFTPKRCLQSPPGMDLPGVPGVSPGLAQHRHCWGVLQVGRGAWALPHPWAGPTGLQEKNSPCISIIRPSTAEGGQLPFSGQNFPQNQPLVHFPSLFLGAKVWKDVSF